MLAIEFSGVTKIYRKGLRAKKVPAVVDLSFSVEENRIVGFVGPNGAGKTTSLKMLTGLVTPTAGTITIRGVPSHKPKARAGISFVSEQPYFYGHLSVRESLEYLYKLNRLSPSEMHKETDKALATVNLHKSVDKKVKELSKGMQQRLNIAQALLGDPSLFIMDEPMSGMDPPGRALFRKIFKQLAREGKTIFFSTHILQDIEQLCDNVVVLTQGRLKYEGPISELLTKGFLGTRITTKTLPDAVSKSLADKGYSISKGNGSTNTIFVPKEKNAEECQKVLAVNEIFPIQIENQRMSLEKVLYEQEE
ncbi:MAG: ATP-binding cassette domain-containing protein [Chitinivibrionales bacterium]|nr:ATP-binding cassette domain-containing protein [Chitinivibrionales bacterium]